LKVVKLEEGLNAALHKTSPHQGERPNLGASGVGFGLLRQREDNFGKSLRGLCGRQEKGENRIVDRSFE
jgi:hypothetical protein